MSKCIQNAVAYAFKVGLRPVMFRMWAFTKQNSFPLAYNKVYIDQTPSDDKKNYRPTIILYFGSFSGDSLKKQAVLHRVVGLWNAKKKHIYESKLKK